MEAALRAIAEPRRREILRLVWSAELPAGEIARRFDVTRPAISQHLSVLKEAGLVTERRDGTRRLYRARPEGAAGRSRVRVSCRARPLRGAARRPRARKR